MWNKALSTSPLFFFTAGNGRESLLGTTGTKDSAGVICGAVLSSFHPPKDAEVRKQWERAIPRKAAKL